MKSYLFKVLATNRFHGQHVMVNSTGDMIRMGLRPGSVRSVACFDNPVLKGLHITTVPETTGKIPGQQEIIDLFKQFPALFNLRHNPVIGEIREGLYAGKQIALFTQAEIRSHFSLDAIRVAAKRGTPYLQTQWHYAKDYAEAEPYYCDPGQQHILDVLRDHMVYNNSPLTKGEHRIFRDDIKKVITALNVWEEGRAHTSVVDSLQHLAAIYVQLIRSIHCDSHRRKLSDVLYHIRKTIMYHHAPQVINTRLLLKILNDIADE